MSEIKGHGSNSIYDLLESRFKNTEKPLFCVDLFGDSAIKKLVPDTITIEVR